jgi:hypothetical protein
MWNAKCKIEGKKIKEKGKKMVASVAFWQGSSIRVAPLFFSFLFTSLLHFAFLSSTFYIGKMTG